MQDDAATMDGREGDDVRAHNLFLAAYAIKPKPDGQPSELSLMLLRAASLAWQRHLKHERRGGRSRTLSEPLKDWFAHHG